MKSKKKSSAAIARAAFDSSPRPVESDAPPQQRERPVTEEARPPPVRLLSAREVMEKVDLTYVSIWKKMKKGQFPAPRELGAKTLRWVEADIDQWIESLPRRQFGR
jgi:prophage regulatory protein